MNMPETMECKYVQWWLSCHPSVTLNDVMAVLWKCHGLSNGEMLTLTNSPTSDSFHWKGSEIDNSSNIPFNTSRCSNYMPSLHGSFRVIKRPSEKSFFPSSLIYLYTVHVQKKLLSLATQYATQYSPLLQITVPKCHLHRSILLLTSHTGE